MMGHCLSMTMAGKPNKTANRCTSSPRACRNGRAAWLPPSDSFRVADSALVVCLSLFFSIIGTHIAESSALLSASQISAIVTDNPSERRNYNVSITPGYCAAAANWRRSRDRARVEALPRGRRVLGRSQRHL